MSSTVRERTLADRNRSEMAVPKKSHTRLDIQGLRALAVLAVIADHLFAWPLGGFVGVDVFFVISGFIITSLLIREYETTNHISFRKFYTRRIKRIIPAATLVLVATLGATYVFFNKARF
jgi:peptidoglycan/LPS O-acetylase OafA/YrhL